MRVWIGIFSDFLSVVVKNQEVGQRSNCGEVFLLQQMLGLSRKQNKSNKMLGLSRRRRRRCWGCPRKKTSQPRCLGWLPLRRRKQVLHGMNRDKERTKYYDRVVEMSKSVVPTFDCLLKYFGDQTSSCIFLVFVVVVVDGGLLSFFSSA